MTAEALLAGAGWAGTRAVPLAGDASTRRYVRLDRGDETAVLMLSPDTAVAPFLRVADHLRSIGLAVPAIIAADPERGELLVEDLGDAVFPVHLKSHPDDEAMLYDAAVDALVHLQAQPVPSWAGPYGPDAMAEAVRIAWTDYLGQGDAPPSAAWRDLEALIRDLLATHAPETSVLIHRDYHAENLIWRPGAQGVQRVGLLDFQDALAGHPAYDLASLLEDARRDVPCDIRTRATARFLDLIGRDAETFGLAFAIQAVQRHLRILGIFSKLARQRGKPAYLSLQPRVHAHLRTAAAHPGLKDLAAAIDRLIPTPRARR